MVIWADVDKPIRAVELRRGLNIIWSPDRRADGSPDLGHGAGKTLFCRLIRYCLGEGAYANADIEARVRTALPQGLVGAEVVVDGDTWSVVRPFAGHRQSDASPFLALDELARGQASGGFDAYLNALQALVIGEAQRTLLPDTRGNNPWLYALACISRDQESRSSGILNWRHKDSDARSPVRERDTSAEWRLQALRVFLDAFSPAEHAVRALRNQGELKRVELEKAVGSLERELGRTRRELSSLLALPAAEVRGDHLGRPKLDARVRAMIEDASTSAVPDEDPELAEGESRHSHLLGQVASLTERCKSADAVVSLARERRKQLEEELVPAARKVRDARYLKCPLTGTPLDRVKAEGCAIALPDEAGALAERLEIESDLRDTKAELKVLEPQYAVLSGELHRLEAESKTLTAWIDRRRALHSSSREAREQAWDARSRVELFKRRDDELEAARRELEAAKEEDEKLARQLESERDQHQGSLTAVGDWFDEVVNRLLGEGARGKLVLDGNGLRGKVVAAGDCSTVAIDSLKVSAFDLSAMLASVEGHGSLPGLLIHDSPREADLSLDIYERLFRLVDSLAREAGDEAPFQYIVTTTTPPPEEFRGDPWLVLPLSGRETEHRLLRRNL